MNAQLQIVRPEDLTPYEARSAKGGNDNRYEMKDFFGHSQDDAEGPQVFLVDLKTPHGVIKPHFHPEDQFQVFVRGTGHIGKTPVKRATMHYVDGFKAYGPIRAEDDGIAFFTVRMRPTKQTHFMPASRSLMQHRTRRPQVVLQFPDEPAGVLYGPCDDGLAIERRVIAAGEPVQLASPADCGGSIVFVVDGELLRDDVTHGPWSCSHLEPGESHADLRAGPDGLELMVLQFPVQRDPDVESAA